MSGDTFVDTNILIYAYDADAGDKNVKALAVIHSPLPHAVARGIIENYLAWQVQLNLSRNHTASIGILGKTPPRILGCHDSCRCL